VGKEHNASTAQVAIAWLLARSPAMLPIPGTLSVEHLEQNLAAARLQLTGDEFEELNELATSPQAAA
jgi:pyridoxine 4-dehydrogenase